MCCCLLLLLYMKYEVLLVNREGEGGGVPVRLLYSVGSVPFGYPRCLRRPTALDILR